MAILTAMGPPSIPREPMPRRLAAETAKLISYCKSDEEVRTATLHALRTAADHGFNHGNTEFIEALCDDLRILAATETEPDQKQRLLTAVETVCSLAAELNQGPAPA